MLSGRCDKVAPESSGDGSDAGTGGIVIPAALIDEARQDVVEKGNALRWTMHQTVRGHGSSDAAYEAYKAAKARLAALTNAGALKGAEIKWATLSPMAETSIGKVAAVYGREGAWQLHR